MDQISIKKIYDGSGNLAQHLSLKGDVLHGVCKFFDKGKLIQKVTYVDGQMEGEFCAYDEDELLLSVSTYKNNLKHGLSVLYVNRSIYAQMNYHQGRLNGKTEYFAPSGRRTGVAYYKDDKLDGQFVLLGENGEPVRIAEFKEGMQHGYVTIYYPSGGVLNQKYFQNDKQEGKDVTLTEDGTLQEISHYRNGLLQGPPTKFDADGKILKTG